MQKSTEKTSFELLDAKMKRNLQDLLAVQKLLKSKSPKEEDRQIQQLQLECSKYQTEAMDYKTRLKEAHEQLISLQDRVTQLQKVEEYTKKHELEHASWKIKLDGLKKDNEELKEINQQLECDINTKSKEITQLESALVAVEKELKNAQERLTEKDKELEECHQRVDQAQDRLNKQDENLKELLAERIIEKERLQKTIDRLKQENASFEQTMGTLRQENNSLEQRLNELEANNSKNMASVKTKSRIPVLTASLSSSTRNSNDIISDDMSQKMKKDILLYQEKLAELTAQNKELLTAFERSKEYSELLKAYLEESRHESDERYKEILRYREEINQLKRAQIYL
ncbi:hypothetical protein RMCBS344292_16203 [Rhizopus microsporus]|nr:hypothetical protein RMCBS344292_16203 [Rhizopus microsporus]